MTLSLLIDKFGANYCLLLGVLVAVSLALLGVKQRLIKRTTKKYEFTFEMDAVSSDFDWQTQEPRVYRPFKKGPYNLTMGLKNLAQDDWLLLEKTYLDYTNQRADIVADEVKSKHTVLTEPVADDSLCEFYDMSLAYMQQKYPQYFYPSKTQPTFMYNAIRDESIFGAASMYKGDTKLLVETLSRTIEEDFLVMMPDEKTQKYHLRGGAFVFPSGLDPAAKVNLSLVDIHGPVPFYKEKIEKSMDKFFSRLKTGHFVVRVNWSCQAHTQLYAVGLNHALEHNDLTRLDPETQDFSKVFLRCERQCLLRLPRTKSVVFTIRTYLTPMSQIKLEKDCASDLCSAIEHLPPATAHYKRAEEWGDAVVAYLRGETNGCTISSNV